MKNNNKKNNKKLNRSNTVNYRSVKVNTVLQSKKCVLCSSHLNEDWKINGTAAAVKYECVYFLFGVIARCAHWMLLRCARWRSSNTKDLRCTHDSFALLRHLMRFCLWIFVSHRTMLLTLCDFNDTLYLPLTVIKTLGKQSHQGIEILSTRRKTQIKFTRRNEDCILLQCLLNW